MTARLEHAAKVLLALLVGGAAGVSGGAAGLSVPDSSPGTENVDIYWMSGVIENSKACVGPLGLHDGAYDLVAADLCAGSFSTAVRMRTYGSSSTPHVTLAAYIWSEVDPYPSRCDYIEASTVQQPSGGLRGTYRYVHAQGGSGYWIDIEAGPSLPRTDVSIGSTTDDSNCIDGWTAYHTHQYADSPHSQPNDFEPLQVIVVWNDDNYIHKWTYPLLDTDGDHFTDAAELYLGTDYLDDCPDHSSDDAWPLDINMDKNVTVVGDVLSFRGHIGATPGDADWSQRLDLNTDGNITVVGDVLMYRGMVGEDCI